MCAWSAHLARVGRKYFPKPSRTGLSAKVKPGDNPRHGPYVLRRNDQDCFRGPSRAWELGIDTVDRTTEVERIEENVQRLESVLGRLLPLGRERQVWVECERNSDSARGLSAHRTAPRDAVSSKGGSRLGRPFFFSTNAGWMPLNN